MSSLVSVNQALNPATELEKLQEVARAALAGIQSLGCDGGAVNLHAQQGVSVNVRQGDVETLEYHSNRGVSVTVYRNKSVGNASTGDLHPDSVRDCVRRAAEIARFTQQDEHAGLPHVADLATEFADLDLWHAEDIVIDDLIETARQVEQAGLRLDSRIVNSEGGSFSVSQSVALLANSDGFNGATQTTSYGQVASFIASDGKNMQRDYWFDAKLAREDLDAPEITGKTAARRTLRRLGARPVKTANMPVLFSPQMASGLLSHFVAAISGRALYRNASFLKDSLRERVFPRAVSLCEYPHLKRGAASACFDAEGVATRERAIVEAGRLESYLLSSYAGRKLGLRTTGHAGGVRNLCIEASSLVCEDLLAGMGNGLLVTEVMGQGVNIVTGDYSRGAAGFLVRDGKILHPVDEVTIAGNLKDIFMNIVALGDDVDTRGRIQSPSILVREMMVAGS